MFSKAWWEQWYPLLGGVTITAVLFYVVSDFPVTAEAAPSLFSAIVSISAITVGFLATAKSILVSIDDKPIIANLKRLGMYDRLITYLLSAIYWSFALAVVSSVCFIVDLKNPVWWHPWLLFLWLFVLVTAGFTCFRVIHLFGKILR